jgi:hypothetical protein
MSINDITLNVTAVCDLALSHIGMKPLETDLATDVSNNNPSALAIEKQWAPCRNEVLGDAKYSCSTVMQVLESNTSVDSDDYPEWESFWTYPSSALAIWSVFDAATPDKKGENAFEVVYNPILDEKIICCNLSSEDTAYAEIAYNITDPSKWDPRLVMSFSYRLAAAICKELTGDDDAAIKMGEIYKNYVSETKRLAHRERKAKPTQSNPIVNARG